MHLGLDARVVNDHFPGVGRHVYHLAAELAHHEPRPTLLVDETAGSSRLDPSELGLDTVPAGSPFAASAPRRARAAVRERGFDVLHAPYILGVRRPSCALVLTFHDAIPLSHRGSMSWWRRQGFRRALAAALRHADLVVTPSRASADELDRVARFPAERVRVVPHAAASSFAPVPLPRAAAVARRLGLRQPYTLCLAGPRPHKNLEGLLEAWARLPEMLTEERTLVIVGPEDRRYPAPAHRLAKLAESRRVLRLDAIAEADLPAALSAAELYVQPSFQEGFGLPVIEAMACGAAVACSDALSETADGAAELFDPRRPDDIARALGYVLTETSWRQRLGQLGLERAARLSWSATARAMLEIYREAAERR